MSPSPVRSHIFQSKYVPSDFALQVILNLHLCQFSVEIEDLLVRQLADGGRLVEIETGHDAL